MQYNRASFLTRNVVSTCIYCRSHYDSLGITPHATQADIKAAYYKLSKVYHPDKNKDSDEASKKFRDITEAYEVLGNIKLRKLYDKGILHTAGTQFEHKNEPVSSEDSYEHAKFYHSRNEPKRVHVRMPDSIHKVYNVDEWSQQHYGRTFARRAAAKERYEAQEGFRISQKNEKKRNLLMVSGAIFIAFLVSLQMAYSDNDNVTFKKKT